MATLEKQRGTTEWRGAIWAQPRHITDLLILLGYKQQLYMAIHEQKIERQRWIKSIEILTTDPAEE
jgi:hypothetical protein